MYIYFDVLKINKISRLHYYCEFYITGLKRMDNLHQLECLLPLSYYNTHAPNKILHSFLLSGVSNNNNINLDEYHSQYKDFYISVSPSQ